jgi:predicted transcriptional regulator
MVWLSNGFLEYAFPISAGALLHGKQISALVVTAEVCSEYPDYKLDWPSDITVWISGVEIGTWTSPGDMGGTRGRLTPEWWPTHSTQYGFRKSWRIAEDGCYIDGKKVSDTPVTRVPLDHSLVVRIGIKEHAEHKGGFNLFGRRFGNYEHDLLLRAELG